MKDYYDVLGVARNATKDDIKKAYRKLAHEFHPDKKGGNEQKFKELNEAYQVLSSDEKRAQYDRFGRPGADGGNASGGWDFGGFRGFEDVDVGDIFETFFGGRGGFGGAGARTRRGRDISIDVEIPFAESIFGTERRVLIRKRATCEECSGTGAARGSAQATCSKCHGSGTIRDTRKSVFGTFTQVIECAHCAGRGKVPEKKCPTCHGEQVVTKSEEIHIVIPAGIENGEVIRMAEKGEAAAGAETGDLYAKVRVLPHNTFRRSRSDLLMKLELPLSEALLGGSRDIEALDGSIKIKIPQGVSEGEILKVVGKGVPREDGARGDLLIEVKIKMPRKITPALKALIEDLKKEGF